VKRPGDAVRIARQGSEKVVGERWIGARRSELELQAELQGAGSAHRIELIR